MQNVEELRPVTSLSANSAGALLPTSSSTVVIRLTRLRGRGRGFYDHPLDRIRGSVSQEAMVPPAETLVEASPQDAGERDQVGVAVEKALGALAQLMKNDPEQARQIRARMATLLD